jgi:hypothetical protein
MRATDMTGRRFGRWTVLARAGNNRHRKAMWLCRCDCGNECVVDGRDLRNGHSKSCGMANRLTTAQVAEICTLAGRLSTPEIARRFDVSPGTIGNILAGRTWREPANETHLA